MLGDSGAARVTSLFCGTIVPSLNALKTGGIACVKIDKRGRGIAKKEETRLAILDRLNGGDMTIHPGLNAERRLDEAQEKTQKKEVVMYKNHSIHTVDYSGKLSVLLRLQHTSRD